MLNYKLVVIFYFIAMLINLGSIREVYGVDEEIAEKACQPNRKKDLQVHSKRSSSAFFAEESAHISSIDHAPSLIVPAEAGSERVSKLMRVTPSQANSPRSDKRVGIVEDASVHSKMSASVTPVSIGEVVDDEADDLFDINEETRAYLSSQGKSKKDILLASIANRALYKEMREDPDASPSKLTLDLSQVSPAKLAAFKGVGGTEKELLEALLVMKKERPQPIVHPEFVQDGTLYSPAGKLVFSSRREMQQARSASVVRKLDYASHIIPITPETAAERKEREVRQYNTFLEQEKLRGKSEDDLKKELQLEQDTFGEYLIYVKRRKIELGADDSSNEESNEEDESDIDTAPEAGLAAVEADDIEDKAEEIGSSVQKITKGELETRFEQLVAKKLTHFSVEGYDLYFSPKTLDLDRIQKDGYTNREAMMMGRTPIGSDGKLMNYHHLTHYDAKTHKSKSIIILISHNLHKGCSGLLHFGAQTYRLPRQRVDRLKFDPAREAFNRAIVKVLQ